MELLYYYWAIIGVLISEVDLYAIGTSETVLIREVSLFLYERAPLFCVRQKLCSLECSFFQFQCCLCYSKGCIQSEYLQYSVSKQSDALYGIAKCFPPTNQHSLTHSLIHSPLELFPFEECGSLSSQCLKDQHAPAQNLINVKINGRYLSLLQFMTSLGGIMELTQRQLFLSQQEDFGTS